MSQNQQSPSRREPQGYTEESGDIAGFWDPDDGSAIHGIPRSVRLSDSSVDATKPSALCFFELIDPLVVLTPKEKTPIQCAKGEMVGVWLKPGMKALEHLGGVPVYMYQTGEVDTGKPNKMKAFKIMKKQRGGALVVEADYRSRSKGTPLPVPVVLMRAEPMRAEGEKSVDEIPFE